MNQKERLLQAGSRFGKTAALLLVGSGGTVLFAQAPDPRAMSTSVILVQGAAGEALYRSGFEAQMSAWKQAAARIGAQVLTIGDTDRNQVAAKDSATAGLDSSGVVADRVRLEKILTDLPREGPSEVWLVLIGHGTWDSREARFNLEGPDLSAGDLAGWLKPVQRPVVVINTSSSSSPWIPVLAGSGRTIITATRSGNERNFARFGQYLAASLNDPAADYDQDGQASLLEWILRASSRTTEFYLADGRIVTEHALIEDNGDGKGTPAEWFRGLRATTKAKDNTPLDGARAQQRFLTPDPSRQQLSPEQLAARERLETEINLLRERKTSLDLDLYYGQLEELFRKLAELGG